MKIDNLSGKMLISSPATNPESYFSKTVIYIVKHDEKGTIGLIINQPFLNLEASDLFIKNSWDNKDSKLTFDSIKPYVGGPVDAEKGFILHSVDYKKNVIEQNKAICLSSNIEVLQDISENKGPKNSLFLFGYCGWDADQLENEIAENQWLTTDQSKSIIFNSNDRTKWYDAVKQLNVNPAYYSSISGSC